MLIFFYCEGRTFFNCRTAICVALIATLMQPKDRGVGPILNRSRRLIKDGGERQEFAATSTLARSQPIDGQERTIQ